MQVELTIPTSLKEITLGQYQKYLEIAEKNENKEFVFQKMIEIFCNVELNKVVNIKATQVVELVNHFTELFKEKTTFKTRFTLGKTEFGFIPDLENITWGEYIDIESNIFKMGELNKALCVMYRPITKKYKDTYIIEPYVADITYSEVMKSLPLDIALSSSVFFWTLGNELLKTLTDCLEETQMNSLTNLASHNSSLIDGDGILQFTNFQKEILQNLTELQTRDYLNV